jgi:hypothetical protein
MRFASQGKGDYAARQLAQLRNRFGGHAVTGTGQAARAGSVRAGARGGHSVSKKKNS